MDIMSKIGVVPMKIIKGQTGLYFKFANGCSSNASPVEVYFKPKFVPAGYPVEGGLIKKVTWLEINILWVGLPEFPDFENGWKVERDGKYCTKEGEVMQGFLIGKMYLPMGEFNDNLPAMHQWLSDKAEFISTYLAKNLMPQVHASTYMPLKTIFDYMLENVQQESLTIENPEILLQKQFKTYQNNIKSAASAKYSASAPGNDEPEPDADGENDK